MSSTESSDRRILVTNIQRFSLHDGPGIRTTVFLKGCSLRCPWCGNPENLRAYPQTYWKDGVKGRYGRWYDTADNRQNELFQIFIKDRAFYEGDLKAEQWAVSDASQIDALPGGVTFSGGEALLQTHGLLPLFQRLKAEQIHMAVETCLFVPESCVQTALSWIDFFYVDVKILNRRAAREILRGDLDLFLRNFDTVMRWKGKTGFRKPVVIRVPVIASYTDTVENRKAVKELLASYVEKNLPPLKIELLKEHNLGISKYESLGYPIPVYQGVSETAMEIYRNELISLGIPVEICAL